MSGFLQTANTWPHAVSSVPGFMMRRLVSKLGSVPFIIPWLMEPQTLICHGSLLVDETMSTLYSVWKACFSPDGMLLAVASTDQVIRVCSGPCAFHNRVTISILEPRCSMHCGLWALGLGYHQEANHPQTPRSHSMASLGRILVRREAGHLSIDGLYSEGLEHN